METRHAKKARQHKTYTHMTSQPTPHPSVSYDSKIDQVCLSVCLSVCLQCLSVCLSVGLSVCLSICLSVCLSVFLFVYLTFLSGTWFFFSKFTMIFLHKSSRKFTKVHHWSPLPRSVILPLLFAGYVCQSRPSAMSVNHVRQSCPSATSVSLVRQPHPSVMSVSHIRQ